MVSGPEIDAIMLGQSALYNISHSPVSLTTAGCSIVMAKVLLVVGLVQFVSANPIKTNAHKSLLITLPL